MISVRAQRTGASSIQGLLHSGTFFSEVGTTYHRECGRCKSFSTKSECSPGRAYAAGFSASMDRHCWKPEAAKIDRRRGGAEARAETRNEERTRAADRSAYGAIPGPGVEPREVGTPAERDSEVLSAAVNLRGRVNPPAAALSRPSTGRAAGGWPRWARARCARSRLRRATCAGRGPAFSFRGKRAASPRASAAGF